MLVGSRLEEEARLGEPPDDLIGCFRRGEPVQPAVRVVEATRLVHRGEHGELVHEPQLEVLLAGAGGDVHDARALFERHLVPRDHAVLDLTAGTEIVERPAVAQPDELRARDDPRERLVRVPRGRDPLAVLAAPVLGVGLHGRRDVRRQRPGRRRPDHERLARLVEQWEPHEQRRVGPVLVDAALRQLVLGERRATARTPLGRAVAQVEPAALVHDLEEPPDVLDVRVGEREVVVPPVHPLAEPDGAFGERLRRPHDHLAAAASELGKPELLDLPLRVEPELPLDTHLDPEPLTVESVLVALVKPAHRLVALKDVLQGSSPGRVDAEHHPVRGHRPVDEAEPRTSGVLSAQALERLLALPGLEDLELERVVVGLVRKWCKDRRHVESV